MKKQYYYILFILLLAMSNCKRDNSSPSIFNEASYPLAVGNSWLYQIEYCSGGAVTDTITLSVVSETTSGPYTKYNCYYLYKGTVTDSGYFLQSDTSLSFTNAFPYPSSGCFPNFHLKFPVETGQYWFGTLPGDSTLVVGVANSCQGAYGESYGPCYSTVEKYNFPHNFMVNDMLLTPKVGLVHQSLNFNSDTSGLQICQSVNLIRYHVQ